VNDLVKKLGDQELRHLWHSANCLHQNFYENWMPPESVEAALDDVKEFVERVRKLI
jgi:CCR4-NOT transcriptional regulation complex NOT5 subunit